jgi:Cu+-exporting ATPase
MTTQQDPVCGERINQQAAEAMGFISEVEGKRFYFCSFGCKAKFDDRPTAFTLAEEEWQASTDGMSEPYPIPPNIA